MALIFGYVLYAVVCGYYQNLMALFCPTKSPAAVLEDDWNKARPPKRARGKPHKGAAPGEIERVHKGVDARGKKSGRERERDKKSE